jgi:hypothetical protein
LRFVARELRGLPESGRFVREFGARIIFCCRLHHALASWAESLPKISRNEYRASIRYQPRYLGRPLKAHGFSVQSAPRERDEYVIARWPTREWVALKNRSVGAASLSSCSTRPDTPSAP